MRHDLIRQKLEAVEATTPTPKPKDIRAAALWLMQKAEESESEQLRDFNAKQRSDMADSGAAMPDGSFPIANKQDLMNAIHAIGRAKDPAAAKAHIKKRAAALGMTDMLPEKWEAGENPELSSQTLRSVVQAVVEIDGPAADSELPQSLRGKNLVRGKPVAVWPIGKSSARDGRVFVVDNMAVESLLADGNAAEMVPFTYMHEEDPEHGADNSGYMLGFSADSKFIYASKMFWTQTAASKLSKGERGLVSPDAYCQSLDPNTLQVLPPGSRTNTFRPMIWRAASLVAIPALTNLPPASLSAGTNSSATEPRKESLMNREELCALLGLPATATDEQIEKAKADLKAAQKLQAEAKAAAASKKKVVEDESAADEANPEDEPEDTYKKSKASAEKDFDKIVAAAAEKATAKATELILLEEPKRQAAATQAKAVDDLLLAAEKDGRVVPAQRGYWEKKFAANFEYASQELSAAGKEGPGSDPSFLPRGASITAGDYDGSLSVDRLPARERDALLSRTAAWSMTRGVSVEAALQAVRGNDKEEAVFHRQVLAANPDWLVPIEDRSGRRGVRWTPSVRPGLKAVELDDDMMKFIGAKLRAGSIGEDIVPRDLQSAALQRQKLSEAANFQPAARFAIPSYGYGFTQGDFCGSEIAVEITGGANEQGYYPIYGTEKFQAIVNAAGVPQPVARNAMDINESSSGTDFKTVTFDGYAHIRWVDNRDQTAGDSVLPMGVFATAMEEAMTIMQNEKELVQAAALRLTTNYNSACQKSLTGSRMWNDPLSTPIQDWSGARMTLWRTGLAMPEIGLVPPDVVEWLRVHPQFLKAAQNAGVGHTDRPLAQAPIEMLVSILGPICSPTCQISTTPGGASPTTPWAQDVILATISRGKIVAPRAFATVVSSGYPVVETLIDRVSGLRGRQGTKVSDMYKVDVAGPASTATKNAFIFTTASTTMAVI